MPPPEGGAADVREALRGRARGLRLLRAVAEVGEEERLVDAALEDRDAHLHALRDDFLALEACLASQLGGRQVNGHWQISLPWERLQQPAHIARVADISKGNRRNVQVSVAVPALGAGAQIGFGKSMHAWRPP